MKNRSRKTILAELNETVSNVPIRGTEEEKASSRMSREDILSGLTSMAGGGAETSSAINDAYAERTARRRAAQATNYNGVLQNYNALLDQMNENVSAYRHGRLQNRAGQAAADMNNATIGKYNEIEAGAQELLDGIGKRGLSASDRLALEKALQELIAAAGENRTAAEQELAALYDPKTGKLLESVPDREWSRAVQERPQDAARWAQMDARAYSQKAEKARRNGNSIYNRFGYEVSRRSPEADEYERRAEEAQRRAAEAQQYRAAQRQAQQEAAVAENPAAYMRWAQMEANAYQKKLDETEYDWTNAREREAYTAAHDDWTRRRDAALAAYDRAYAALQEQEAAAYKGALEAPAEPWKRYSEINDESRWIDTINSRDLSATRLLGNTAAGDWLDENVAYANFLNENIANMATRAARMQPEAYMSEAQRQTYNYLAATKGEEAAEAYYARILPGLEAARAQETQRRTAELTEAHPYLMTAQSVAMGPGKIPAGVSDIAKAVTGQEINKNDVLHLPVQTQQTIRSVAPEATDWTGNARIFGQDADAFLYGTITSALDSAYNMAIGSAVSGVASMAAGGLGAAQSTELTASMVSALMGAEMLPETVMAEKEKGRDDAQAVAIGIIRSLIEAVTEKYSIEAFLGDPRAAGAVLGKAFIAEGSEEVASNWLNRIVDIVAADPEGITAQYQALREQGKSKAEALTEVLGGMLGEDAGSFLAGGLSGLAMSGTSYAVGSHVQNAQMGQYYQGDAQALVDEALQLDPQNRLAQRMDAQLAEGKNVRSAQLGRLAAQNEEQIAQAAQRAQQAQQTTQETAQEPREPARRAEPAAQQAETGARQYGAPEAETAAVGAQAARQETESRTRKSGKGGTSLLGTDVTRVTHIGAYDMEVLRADGTKEKLSAIDQRGTALEILQHAQEMPEYRDTVTVNGMLRSYEAFLNGRVSTPSMASGFYERYAAAVAAGAEGESRTAALSGITSRRLQDAISNAWQRGTEIEKGRRIAAGMGSAGSAAIARYGYLYPELFRTFYQAGQQGASFQQAMQAAGAKSLGETKKAEMTAAWKAGRKDGYNETERYAVSDAGSQRENGLGAGGKAGGLEAGTGGSEGREGGRVSRRGGGDAENRTSLKNLGVRSGTDAPQEVVSREKNEHGGEIITVSDRLLVRGQDGTEREVQAIQSGNNVILRADDPMLEQHKAHELEHIRQRSMTDEEITAVFREKTKSLSDERLRRILSAYAMDYYGLYGADDTTVADLYREYLADEAAGIRHKETDQDVILPGEQTGMMDRRGEAYAMRGNQGREYSDKNRYDYSQKIGDVTQSQQFKRWFGDWENHPEKASKIVNADGTPKVIYHQTASEFYTFSNSNPVAGANDSETPNGFFAKDNDNDIGIGGKRQMALYGDMKKPLHFADREAANAWYSKNIEGYAELQRQYDQLDQEYQAEYDTQEEKNDDYYEEHYDEFVANEQTVTEAIQAGEEKLDEILDRWKENTNKIRRQQRELLNDYFLRGNSGYDGIILDTDGKRFGKNVKSYIFFRNTQLKSAFDNIGTFDRENPDIRYSVYEPQSSAEYAQMQRQQAQQQRTLQEESVKNTFALRQQFTEGTERNVSATELPDIAAELRRIYGRNAMSQTALQQRLEEIAMEKARAEYPMEAYRKAKDAADALAAEMIRNASGQTEAAKQDWDGIRAAMRPDGKPVKLFIDGANRALISGEGGYEGMRKRMMGYAFLSSGGIPVNEFYEELSGKFPDFFPDTLTEQADQLTQIAQVIDRFRQIFRSPYAGDLAADTEMLSQDILQRLYNSRQPGANEAAYAEQHEDMLRAYYETRMQNARSAHRQQVEQMREDYARRKQQQQTKREEQTLRQKLLKISQRLDRIRVGNEWYDAARALVGELDTVAVRMTGKTIVGDQIGNVSSEGIETTGTTKEGKKIVTLEALREFVNKMKAENPDFLAGRDVMQRIERLEKTPIDSLEIGEVRRLLNAMSELENEMRTHNKMIKSEEKREIAVLAAEVRSNIAASEGVKPASAEKLLSDYITTNSLSPVRFLRRVTGYMESDPLYRAGIELQRGETAMLDYQRRAEARFRSFQEDKAFMASLSGKNSKPIEITARTDHGIQTVKITPDMRIAIYLHSRNNDNVRHAMYGGMIVPDYRLLMKGKTEEAYTAGTHIYLTRSQMQEIANGMSAMERNYANAIEQYYNTFSKEEINAVSRELRGYDIAVVRHYYPIEVNRNFVNADPETVRHDAKIESSGFTKERLGAANTINLRGATETLTRSIEKHSKYVGLAIPIRNFGKLYGNSAWKLALDEMDEGYVEDDRRTQQTTVSSVQEILQRKWGAEAGRYVDKLMADLQNPVNTKGKWGSLLSKVRSNYAGAVLTLNLSVAMKQAASYPTAAAVVGWAPLAKAMGNWQRTDLDLVAKYTPLLWYRSKGYSTKELGDLAKGNRSLPKALNWIQAIDVATTKKLWKAAEYYVRDNQKGLTIGSDDYYRAVAEVYERIILETQPNYTTMERPQLLRENDTLLQNLAMFKTQPMQNLNIAYDAIANLRAKERQLKAMQEAAGTDPAAAEQIKKAQAAVQTAKRSMANSISALVISAAVFSAMTLLWNLLRGKMKKYKNDEDEMTAASFMKGFGGDMLSSFAGMVPFGSDIYNTVWSMITKDTYYGMEALAPSAISDFLETVVKLPDNVKDVAGALQGDKAVGDVIWNMNSVLKALTKLIAPGGISLPLENVENAAKMVIRIVMKPFFTAEEADYWYRYYTTKTTATNRKQEDYADIYAAALAGNMDGYSAMRGKMEGWIWKSNDKYESGEYTRGEAQDAAEETVNNAMQNRIKEDYIAGDLTDDRAHELLTEIGGMDAEKADENLRKWACERDTGIKYDDLKSAYESGDISAAAAAKYLETYGGKDAGAAEDTVQKWQYAQDSGNTDASAGRAEKYYEFAEPAGINISVFDAAYTFAAGAEADKDEDGKSISGSAKQKVVDYIKSLDLTAAQKEALWNAVKGTWSDKDTPWA